MHEAPTMNGTGHELHEEDGDSMYARLVREVAALNAQHDQLRSTHADAKKRQHDGEERARNARRAKERAREVARRAIEKAAADQADAERDAERGKQDAAAATDQLREVTKLLRKRQAQLATEESERTPRKVTGK